MAKHDDHKKRDEALVPRRDDAKTSVEAQPDPNAPAPGSFETEEMRKAREEREKAAAEAGGDTRMSPVNPRKPLDKEPVYAAGVGPLAAGDFGSSPPPDPRIPPENVTVPGVAPGGRTVTAADVASSRPAPEPAQKTAEPAPLAPARPGDPVHVPVITPAQAGLAQPHLRAGLDPLPEEDPTPSTVPIPPPGPRRVA